MGTMMTLHPPPPRNKASKGVYLDSQKRSLDSNLPLLLLLRLLLVLVILPPRVLRRTSSNESLQH